MSRIDQLTRLHAADPLDADVMYMLAQERGKAGEHDGAVEWFDRCLAADPRYVYAYYHKAKALEAAGRKPEAAAALRAGLEVARRTGNEKGAGEIAAYLESL